MADDDTESPDPAAQDEGAARKPRQAVVVIHGMGEQRPMSTLRDFVDAVWTHDPSLTGPFRGREPNDDAGAAPVNKIWITPDRHAGSHELRRITTPKDVRERRTDFFELYWADLIQGTTRGRLFAWMSELLLRRRSDIPADARGLYWTTWIVAVVVALAMLALALSAWATWIHPVTALIVLGLATAVLWALDHLVLPYFGDVATYVQASPGTVESRRQVRERGLNLLRSLSDDPDYDRIVLVGHSLGSVIAYDLVQILWAERRPKGLLHPRDRELTTAVRAVEPFAALPADDARPFDRGAFRRQQWQLHEELRKASPDRPAWKVSDLVTIGSPLTHAEFLIARNAEAWRRGIAERLFSTCPPLSDKPGTLALLYYEDRRARAVHHAAPFAAVRWTNIFDRGAGLLSGDPVSGALAENFGPGVEDVRVELRGRHGRLFTHTLYWSRDAEGAEIPDGGTATTIEGRRSHLDVVRDAIDLLRREEPARDV